MNDDLLSQMAYDIAKRSQPGRMQYSLNAFSKYNGDSAPDTFVNTFENEAALCGVEEDETKVRIFPSLMTGKA